MINCYFEKVRLESNICSERDSLNANIQRLDFELSEITSERARCTRELGNLDGLKQQENTLKITLLILITSKWTLITLLAVFII
jgi:hypothetical protein